MHIQKKLHVDNVRCVSWEDIKINLPLQNLSFDARNYSFFRGETKSARSDKNPVSQQKTA